jgi:DNA recombination protein RmuC
VLFLPAEALLAEALARDPGLLEAAFARNVILATPTTLQALLRTISHICRQEATAENARQIQALGRELHDRLGTLVGHFDKLGAALGSAVGSYNRAMGSLDSRVLVTARRFSELAGESAGFESPRSVEATPRIARPRDGGEVDNLTLAGLSGVLPLEGASISLREPAPGRNQ